MTTANARQAGLREAADFIANKADDYANQFGFGVAGSLSFGNQVKMDHYTSLTELAEEIRILAAQSADASNAATGHRLTDAQIIAIASEALCVDADRIEYSAVKFARALLAHHSEDERKMVGATESGLTDSQRATAETLLKYWESESRPVAATMGARQTANFLRALLAAPAAPASEPDYRKELAEAMGHPDGVSSSGKRIGLAWELLIAYIKDWRGTIEEMERAEAAAPAPAAPKCTRCEYIGKCDCEPAPAAQADSDAERALDQAMRERDAYHEMADKLADGIAKYFGEEIGEHSNLNCPWRNAVELIEEAGGTPVEILGARLIDAWCAANGKQIPWDKAVEITAIATKMSEAERARLLALDDRAAMREQTENGERA